MLRNLIFFWRMNLAVALGAAVAAAVLTGALLVGDSVRGSLRELTLERLGGIDHALAGQRFFDEAAAADLTEAPDLPGGVAHVAPAILLQGNVQHAKSRTRATKVSLQGVDRAFLDFFPADAESLETLFAERRGITPSAVINEGLARELGAEVGDDLLFHLKRWSDVPRGSLLGRKDTGSVVQTLRLEVAAILPDRGVGRFGLSVHQSLPWNVFIALPALQKGLRQPGEINGLLFAEGGTGGKDASEDASTTGAAAARATAEGLQEHLRAALSLENLGFVLETSAATSAEEGFLTLESREYILKPTLEPVIDRLADAADARTLEVLTYLVNRLELGEKAVPYSTVTAFDIAKVEPFGELRLSDGTSAPELAEDEILLNDWTASQLGAAPGDEVVLTYFVVGPREDLREESTAFRVAGIVALEGLAADAELTQDYPGIADSDNMADWDPPFPIELAAVRPEDEAYWDEYRGTPKAFVAEATGRRLWASRWGDLTSVRVAPPPGGDLETLRAGFAEGLAASVDLEAYGLAVQPVKSLGLRASGGATDFGGMFLGFSMFLIASAALLAALLFGLGVEQRVGEVGLRTAIGEPPARVRRRLLAEGGILAALGSLGGLAGAVGYAELMMLGLRTWWLPAVGTSRLELHVTAVSLVAGYVGSVAVVLFAIWTTLRRLAKLSTPQLLRRVVEPRERRPGRVARWTATIALPLAGALLVFAVASGQTTNPTFFFIMGPAFLIGALALYALRLAGSARIQKGNVLGRPGMVALLRMAAINSGRNRRRSLLAATLVASACFLIVTVASFEEGFSGELDKDSGTGGYALVAEAAIPIFQDLETTDGRFELGLGDDATEALEGAEILPFRLLPGDDTSCLNLYQPSEPRVLGVPPEQIERGGFSFKQTAKEVENPWTLLEEDLGENVIPAFGDANSTQWILKVGLGEDLEIENEFGETIKLRLVGTLKTSLFQSELLISDEHFRHHFPSASGFRVFLVDAPAERVEPIVQTLESGLDDYGFDAVSASEKLASFHAVQNTYLATFRTVGGLGLLLGTLGLAVVLVRNVLERQKELATLRAFGFRHAVLRRMIIVENGLLLLWGLAIGTVAALLTAGPHLLAEAEHVAWAPLAATLAAILVVGLLACTVAAHRVLAASLLPALKMDR